MINDNKKIYIKSDGTKETGARIIAELERRGGANMGEFKGDATIDIYYYIDQYNNIAHRPDSEYLKENGYKEFVLPEQVYIVQNGTYKGADIIAELIRRGGKNANNLRGNDEDFCVYHINRCGIICKDNNLAWFERSGWKRIYLGEPAPAHEIAQAQHQKVYIVQDGTLNGADIIKELERRGGINTNGFDGTIMGDEEPALYYIDYDERIESDWAHNANDLEQQGYTRVYLGTQTPDNEPATTPANAPVIAPNDADAQCTATPTNAPHATISDKTMTINFADAIPQGYEVVNDKGQPITEIELTLQRKHYRPSKGETYWIALLGDDDLYYPVSFVWQNADHDLGNYESGNCFKEKEQAQQLADAMNTAYLTTIKLIHNDK